MSTINNIILSVSFLLTAICLTFQIYELASTWAGIMFLSYFAGIVNDYYNGER